MPFCQRAFARKTKKFNLFSLSLHQQSHEITNLETFTQYLVSVQVFNPEVRKKKFPSWFLLLICFWIARPWKFNFWNCHGTCLWQEIRSIEFYDCCCIKNVFFLLLNGNMSKEIFWWILMKLNLLKFLMMVRTLEGFQ